MPLAHGLSIQSKLKVVIVSISGAALLLACAMFSIFDYHSSKARLIDRAQTVADIVGSSCTAALTFGDPRTANEDLNALRADPTIRSAAIYAAGGRFFAGYSTGGFPAEITERPPVGAHRFFSDSLAVTRPIVLEGHPIGSVVILMELVSLRERLGNYAVIALGVLMLSTLVAFLLSERFHRIVSQPIERLVAATRAVTNARDYSIRVERLSSDELGMLVDGFNEMLAQIQLRETEIERHRNHLEELVAARTVDLERSNAELEQFAYVASHDLQEPLRMVSSYVSLLEKRYQGTLDAQADKYIHYAVDGAQRMHVLINDLLNYSRVGRGGITLSPVDLDDVVQQARSSLGKAIAEAGATLRAGKLPQVLGDRMLLGLLLQNLISNAVKYRRDEPPVVEIAAERTGEFWIVSVRDNGIGIDAQYHDRIFQIFQRLHERTKFPGTGIGLAIARKIVDRHGGNLSVESTPGEGSTFKFSVRAA